MDGLLGVGTEWANLWVSSRDLAECPLSRGSQQGDGTVHLVSESLSLFTQIPAP